MDISLLIITMQLEYVCGVPTRRPSSPVLGLLL